MHLPVHPELLSRPSPLAAESAPSRKDDTAPAAPPFESPDGCVIPSPRDSKWNIPLVTDRTRDFPYPALREMAISIMDGSYNSFVGDPHKAVVWPGRYTFSQEVTTQLLAKLNKAAQSSAMWGPLPFCPFRFARPYPPGLVPKHRRDPDSKEVRLTSDMGAGGKQSVNQLDRNPLLLATHFSVTSFVNLCLSFGVGLIIAQDDVEDAFKMNPINEALMHTVVAMVMTKEGPQFFGDRAHNFGHVASEYGWQAESALVEWLLRQEPGINDVYLYVDDDWQFFPFGSDVAAGVAATDDFFSDLGMTRNKKNVGTSGKVLGWLFDVANKGPLGRCILSLAPAKLKFYKDEFAAIQGRVVISLKEAEWLAGTSTFLSEAIPGTCTYVAPFNLVKLKLLSQHRRRPKCPKSAIECTQSPLVRMNRGSRREYVVLTSRNREVGFWRCVP